MSKPLIPNKERRAVPMEIRMDGTGEGESPMMRGHAGVFNSLSEVLGGCFREIIKPGAFTDALNTSDVRGLFNHNPDLILGRTSAGTLRVAEDSTGLAIEIDPPDTTCGRDLQVSMKRGDIKEMSFGFTVADGGDEWRKDPDHAGHWIRTINKIERLYDVSPVTFPAYPETDCALRSLESVKASEVPTVDYKAEARKRKLEIEEAYSGVEQRVNMGWCGENTVGVCQCCNLEGCLCSDCPNLACCNMQTAENGGACTKCMKPGCCCLNCPNTDKCKLMKMYSM